MRNLPANLPTTRSLLLSVMRTIGWQACVAQKRNVKELKAEIAEFLSTELKLTLSEERR